MLGNTHFQEKTITFKIIKIAKSFFGDTFKVSPLNDYSLKLPHPRPAVLPDLRDLLAAHEGGVLAGDVADMVLEGGQFRAL